MGTPVSHGEVVKMPFTKFVEVGRIVYINKGQDAGKIAAIVDILDQNRGLLDGPQSGVARQARRDTDLHLTNFVIKVPRGATEKTTRMAWEAAKIDEKWKATSWCRRIEKKQARYAERPGAIQSRQSEAGPQQVVRSAFFSLRKKGTKGYEATRKRVAKLRAKA